MQKKKEPVKYCRNPRCKKQLVRKRYPGGRLESLKSFNKRLDCDRECYFQFRYPILFNRFNKKG